MAYISRSRMCCQPDTGQFVEHYYRRQFVPGRQPVFERGELLSMAVFRVDTPGEAAETYELVSRGINKAAHDRDENRSVDQATVAVMSRYLAAPERETQRSIPLLRFQRLAV